MTNSTNINHDQRKKIFGLAKEGGISNEELHDHMYLWANVLSLSEQKCTSDQARKIIDSLQSIIRSKPKQKRSGTITDKQLSAIYSLQKILKWNSKRIAGFTKHTVDKNDLDSLNVDEASKLIIGLKKMIPKEQSEPYLCENKVTSIF